jgi:hypothetical protein
MFLDAIFIVVSGSRAWCKPIFPFFRGQKAIIIAKKGQSYSKSWKREINKKKKKKLKKLKIKNKNCLFLNGINIKMSNLLKGGGRPHYPMAPLPNTHAFTP